MIIEVEHLSKRFPVRRTWGSMLRAPLKRDWQSVVRDVSFSVAEGEIFGVLGQNGAGKTTIFKMLSTLILPDSGSARIAGFDVVSDENSARRVLAPVIANERSLYWRLSALENLRLFTAMQGLYGAEARSEEQRVLRATGLTDTGEKMVGAFSSGMRQRLLIARALIGRPRVLLLDEPTRSLDPISARDFRRFLSDTVVKEEGCTVLLATHDADEVWDLCDRVGVLERGELLAVDRTEVMRHQAGRDHFRLWVHKSDAESLQKRAGAAGYALKARGEAPEEGWLQFDCEVTDSVDGAARALKVITAGEERVARFERISPGLADLIERVVHARKEEAVNA